MEASTAAPAGYDPQTDSTPKLASKDPSRVVLAITKRKDPKAGAPEYGCPCGCGEVPNGPKAQFCIGHDARLRGKLIRAHNNDVEIVYVADGKMGKPQTALQVAKDHGWDKDLVESKARYERNEAAKAEKRAASETARAEKKAAAEAVKAERAAAREKAKVERETLKAEKQLAREEAQEKREQAAAEKKVASEAKKAEQAAERERKATEKAEAKAKADAEKAAAKAAKDAEPAK